MATGGAGGIGEKRAFDAGIDEAGADVVPIGEYLDDAGGAIGACGGITCDSDIVSGNRGSLSGCVNPPRICSV